MSWSISDATWASVRSQIEAAGGEVPQKIDIRATLDTLNGLLCADSGTDSEWDAFLEARKAARRLLICLDKLRNRPDLLGFLIGEGAVSSETGRAYVAAEVSSLRSSLWSLNDGVDYLAPTKRGAKPHTAKRTWAVEVARVLQCQCGVSLKDEQGNTSSKAISILETLMKASPRKTFRAIDRNAVRRTLTEARKSLDLAAEP
jgi:hypothetical protein